MLITKLTYHRYLNPITKTNNLKLIHNFGRREEVMETSKNKSSKQTTKRATSEIRARNGNYIGTYSCIITDIIFVNRESVCD